MNGDFENFKEQVQHSRYGGNNLRLRAVEKERPELLGLLPVSRRENTVLFGEPRQEHVLLLWLP